MRANAIGLLLIASVVTESKALYQALLESDSGESVEVMAERWLQELGLRWPLCVDGLQSKLAIDLQANEIDGEVSH